MSRPKKTTTISGVTKTITTSKEPPAVVQKPAVPVLDYATARWSSPILLPARLERGWRRVRPEEVTPELAARLRRFASESDFVTDGAGLVLIAKETNVEA